MAIQKSNIGAKVYLMMVNTVFIPLALLNTHIGLFDPLWLAIVLSTINSCITVFYFKKSSEYLIFSSLIIIQIYFGLLLTLNEGSGGYIIPLSYVPIGAIIFANSKTNLYIFLPLLTAIFILFTVYNLDVINGPFYTLSIPICAFTIIASNRIDFFNLEENLRKESNQLKRINNDLEQFVYAAAHDLKSPIRGVYHLSQFLEDDFNLNHEGQKHVKSIQFQAEKMEITINLSLIHI